MHRTGHCRGDFRVRRIVGVAPFAVDAEPVPGVPGMVRRAWRPPASAHTPGRPPGLVSAAMPEPAEPSTARPADAGTTRGEPTVEEPTRAQAQHARRVAESRATVPDLSLSVAVDAEAALALRDGLLAPAPTLDDLVLKAAALALREAPRANGSYRDARLVHVPPVNVGVALPAQGSTVYPVVNDADVKGLAEIAAETVSLARRAREGAITQPELSGGTFTVTSLAAFGIARVTALVHQPQAAALGVGAVEARAVVRDGAVEARRTLDLTLTVDHRILHAADAARLLRRIRELLEQPALLTR